MSGKGSKQRPTDKEKFDAAYDEIFGKKDQKVKQAMVTDLNWDGIEDDEPENE